ncbi:MAG: ABC transporter substrate-binding protein [Dehalococcoidia bacterium]
MKPERGEVAVREGNYWTARTSRRRLLAGAGATGAAITLAACSGSSNNNGSKAATSGAAATTLAPSTSAGAGAATAAPGIAAPRGTAVAGASATVDEAKVNKNGTLHLRQNAIFATINPYKGLDSGLYWGFLIFDHLWYVPTDTGVRELFLASSIEQPDPLTITCTLKQAVFHDKPPANGRKVTAQDIKASFEAAGKAPQASGGAYVRQFVDSITTPDDSTITFKIKQPDAWVYYGSKLGNVIASSIIPREVAAAPDMMDKDLVGSGHFQFVSHENGANFKLKRFDNWRVKGAPWLAGIEYRLIQEQAAALAAFSAQQIDQVGFNNKPEKDQIVQQVGKAITPESTPTSATWAILGRADGPWADPRTRQAIYLAINRQEFIDLIGFGDGTPSALVPPIFGKYALTPKDAADTWFKYDPAGAKKLFDASGFDTSKEYTIHYIVPGDNQAQMAQITQSQLQKTLGLKLKLVGDDLGTFIQKTIQQSQYDAFVTYSTLALETPDDYIANYRKNDGLRDNTSRFLDDELDKLVVDSRAILDDDKRAAAIKEIQRKGYEKAAPFYFVFQPIGNSASWNYVKGQVRGRGSYGLFNDFEYIDKTS